MVDTVAFATRCAASSAWRKQVSIPRFLIKLRGHRQYPPPAHKSPLYQRLSCLTDMSPFSEPDGLDGIGECDEVVPS